MEVKNGRLFGFDLFNKIEEKKNYSKESVQEICNSLQRSFQYSLSVKTINLISEWRSDQFFKTACWISTLTGSYNKLIWIYNTIVSMNVVPITSK